MNNIFEWNVRGINSLKKQDVLRFLQENKVRLCELLEIKLKIKNIGYVISNLFMIWSVILNFSMYKGGRILIFLLLLVFDVNVLSI